MKHFAALILAVTTSTAAIADPLPGSILVEDPSRCIRKELLGKELSSLLDASQDYRAYTLDVTAAKAGDDGKIAVALNLTGGAEPLQRSLSINASECEDAARLIARVVAGQMHGAPASTSSAARRTIDRIPDDFIWFQRNVVVTVEQNRYGSTARVDDYEVPVVGPYRKELSWPEFYEKTGHDDLASRFKSNMIRKFVLWGSGAGVAVLGSLVAGVALTGGILGGILLMVSSIAIAGIAGPWIGLGVLVGGVVLGTLGIVLATLGGAGLIVAGNLLPAHPVEPHDIRKFADEHNQTLGEAPSDDAIKQAVKPE